MFDLPTSGDIGGHRHTAVGMVGDATLLDAERQGTRWVWDC
jgi:hypothetical protein